ncbi:hypothetical protein V8F33_001297 [Rhypophila sp. PSN 637]
MISDLPAPPLQPSRESTGRQDILPSNRRLGVLSLPNSRDLVRSLDSPLRQTLARLATWHAISRCGYADCWDWHRNGPVPLPLSTCHRHHQSMSFNLCYFNRYSAIQQSSSFFVAARRLSHRQSLSAYFHCLPVGPVHSPREASSDINLLEHLPRSPFPAGGPLSVVALEGLFHCIAAHPLLYLSHLAAAAGLRKTVVIRYKVVKQHKGHTAKPPLGDRPL